jgi:alpha-galactosidase
VETPIELERGEEYAAHIINALMGGDPFEFNGNVPNTGLITNLPQDACVEVPVWVSRKGFEPVHVGALPPQCSALTNLSAQIEEMAVEGALTGDPRLIFQAIAYDPLTSAVLSLAEIKQMVNQMFEQNRTYLPQFKHLNV